MKLDAKTVAALKLGGKTDVIHFDDALPGFGYRLRQGAGGKVMRSWIAQYRRAGGSRRVLLGSAEVLSAEQARQKAKKTLAEVALGRDPQGDKAARRDADKIRLGALVDEFLEVKRTTVRRRTKSPVRPKTLQELQRYLKTGDYFRPLHGMAVHEITQAEVAACLRTITRKSSENAMMLARGALSSFFVWAMQEGLASTNPVVGTRRADNPEPGERVLSDAELAAIWRGCGDDDFGRIVKLLILTGARRQEIGGIAFSELDLERDLWTLPGARSKNHRPLCLPLMPMMREIIDQVPRRATRDHLFGARAAVGFTNWPKAKDELDARIKPEQRWHIHDIRRSVATRMADLGVAPHIIEQILNHQSGHKSGVAGIYNRSSYQIEVRNALALWCDHVASIVSGSGRKILALPRSVS